MRMLLQKSLGDYVAGGLGSIDASRFPLTLKDLTLNEKKIQEDMDEDGGSPFQLSSGTIGAISVNPGWLGSVEVCATNVVLNFSFSAVRAMNWALKPEEPEDVDPVNSAEDAAAAAPPVPVPAPSAGPVAPRFCSCHNSSEKRVKMMEPKFQECTSCHISVQTSYADFVLCPVCSDRQQRCLICGSSAPTSSCYIPAQTLKEPREAGGSASAAGGAAGPCAGPVQSPRGPGVARPLPSTPETDPRPQPQAAPPGRAASGDGGGRFREPPSLPPPQEPSRRPERATPQYCAVHGTSEMRPKGDVRPQACAGCRVEYQTSYVDFTLCPVCSEAQGRCVICGATSFPGAVSGGGCVPRTPTAESNSQSAALSGGGHQAPDPRAGAAARAPATHGHPTSPGSPAGGQQMGVYGTALPGSLSNSTVAREATIGIQPSKLFASERQGEQSLPGPLPSPLRPFPQGGWRDSVATMQLDPHRRAHEVGCGPLCASHEVANSGITGNGLLKFLDMFDVGSWGQCMAQNSLPRGTVLQDQRQPDALRTVPPHGFRAGGGGPGPLLAPASFASAPPPQAAAAGPTPWATHSMQRFGGA